MAEGAASGHMFTAAAFLKIKGVGGTARGPPANGGDQLRPPGSSNPPTLPRGPLSGFYKDGGGKELAPVAPQPLLCPRV